MVHKLVYIPESTCMRKKDAILTKGERDALVLIARGMTNEEIAQRLSTSTNKVKALIHQACIKLEAHNRVEAVFKAIRQKTLTVDEIFSLDEMADLLSSLSPETIEAIAKLLRHSASSNAIITVKESEPQQKKGQSALLTQRERDVLALVARGLSNQEIAAQLYTSVSTVRSFLYQVCTKLEAPNREQAFILAVKKKAITVTEVFSLGELVELLASVKPEVIEEIAQLLRQRFQHERLPSVS
jgi:DNA-binding CsgD family transcriptional regulator